MSFSDTICACGTAAGTAAVALVRVSGPLCGQLACDIFDGGKNPPVARVAVLGRYRGRDGGVIDQVLWTYFAENASYTGQAMLEISTHGNPLIVQSILGDLRARGCRMAEPGEFTRTAFLNGKLDLSQAEAVADVINASGQRALKVAQHQLEGALGERITQLTDELLQILAEVEATIDFAEEDLPSGHEAIPARRIEALCERLKTLGQTRRYRALLQDGARAVILGAPNAGKSSLLNALLGQQRALVSHEPGTTRDYITERWHAGPYCIQLIDTAGIREGAAALEQQGIDRAMEKIESADLLLFVVDASAPFPTLPARTTEFLSSHKTLLLLNKSDLPRAIDEAALKPFQNQITLSLKTGEGLEQIAPAIVRLLEQGLVIPEADAVLVSLRHGASIDEALAHLTQALAQWRRRAPAEFVASDLRAALDNLGDIVGRRDNEAMLDKLFSTFCIGK